MAQEHFALYYSETRVTATVSPKDEPTATKQALMTTTRRQCYFCGRAYHERKYCPVINSTCFSCGKIGHFSRVCRSNNGSGKRLKSTNQSETLSLASLTSMACPGNLLRSAILVNLNDKNLTALIDSGSSEIYINSKVSKDLKLKVYPSRSNIQIASSAMKMKSAPTTSHSTWWCSPLPCTGEGRNGLSIPRGSHPRVVLLRTTLLLIFYPCCPMRGHIWTAFLNSIDRPPLPLLLPFGQLFLVPPSTLNLFTTHLTHR